MVEQDRLCMVPCEPDMISLIATKVMLLSMGYLWCVASTIQKIRHHKSFMHAPIKSCLDYSIFD